MRFLIRGLIGLVVLIALGIAGLIAWPYWPVLQDQFGSQPYRTWLAEHRTEIDPSADPAELEFDEAIHDARFVMLSEIHGYRAVQAVDLALVRHFASTGPARTYLAELGADQAMAFNLYLATGEDGPVRAVFDAWADEKAQWANEEFFAKLTALRALNGELPEARRIWFVGVDAVEDAQRMATLTERAGTQAQPGFETYDEVQALNARIGAMSLARPEDAGRYTHFLGNMAAAAELDATRRFYGLWGLFHGTKTTVNGIAPLAVRLNREGGVFENSVATLTTLCIDGCYNMMPARAMPGFLNPEGAADYLNLPMSFDVALVQRARGVNDLKAVMGETPIAAFRMTGADSPYAEGERLRGLTGYLMMLQGFDYGGPAAELTDYYVVIRGSAPLTPWRGETHDVGGDAPAGIASVTRALQ